MPGTYGAGHFCHVPMRSLSDVRIAVTRAQDQAEELAIPLRERGAQVLLTPLIKVAPAVSDTPLRAAIHQLPSFDWIVFTSANGVERFAHACRESNVSIGSIAAACVGPATEAVARARGFDVRVVPDEFTGDAVATALATRTDIAGARILLARAAGARASVADILRERGADVTDVEVYRSVPDEAGAAKLQRLLTDDGIDIVTFTSGSTVRYFSRYVGGVGRARVAVIGPITADAAMQHGITVAAVANPHTTAGLVAAIETLWRSE